MTICALSAILVMVRAVHLGSFRATPYGLCAAAGLVLGMTLVQRTARRAGMSPDTAWDAGLFAIFCCFVASRLLLIARDPRVFLRYPLLFLALPSLTLGGMTLAAVLTWIYLRYKAVPALRMLDVFAAPFALLGAFSELGHWFERSEIGMPTHVPWAVRGTFSGDAVRVHPVALYGVACGLLLATLLWRALPSVHDGRVAAWGLMAGGVLAFLLNMLSQPLVATNTAWLEPGQWIALAAVLAGGVLWTLTSHVSRNAELPSEDGVNGAGLKSATLDMEIR